MRAPSPAFELDYRHDRRKHRHRCRCCSKVINDGERVLMARQPRASIAIHVVPCANVAFATASDVENKAGWLWRDAMECWGTMHLRACGFRVGEHPMEQAGAVKGKAA